MKEIKIGDRVRFKKFCINHDEEIRVAEGDYGTVVFVDKIGIGVDLDVPQYVSVKATDVELADCDPKTAFLTELQALMKRYNATIDVDGDECALRLTIDIDGHAIEYTAYDYFTGKEKQTALTPDNIFNYDKE